jgi:2-polyprenyl-3-methyl-5-hydroxy-6-metoxy-1,4-benzoquinol methylase
MVYKLKIPLFYKVHDKLGNDTFSETYTFNLKLDKFSGLTVQECGDELRVLLHRIYSQGSMMIGSMDGDDLAGGIHAADSIEFICKILPEFRSKRILEIGCGNGTILNQLAKLGANCVGIEPGQQFRQASSNGIRLVNDFFPSKFLAGEKFDVVSSFNVLEHIEHLSPFLGAINASLVDGGDFIFCVPNCGPYLASGDMSIFLHEHFNYFTIKNIGGVLEGAGFSLEQAEVSSNFALLLVHARKICERDYQNQGSESTELDVFMLAMQDLNRKIEQSMSNYEDNEIAIYCPNRALNIMCQLDRSGVRIVEDTPSVHGKYYPFFKSPVEDFSDLAVNPPKAVYIFSYTHGEMLRSRCLHEAKLNLTEIHVVSDFY